MSNPKGCKNCRHSVWQGGDRVCLYRPHDYRTNDQRAIVEWLKSNRDRAFADPLWTCPRFEDQ